MTGTCVEAVRSRACAGSLSRFARAFLALALVASLAGCERLMGNMYDQPRYKPLARSTIWPDERASRAPPAGTVAYASGTFAGSTSGRRNAAGNSGSAGTETTAQREQTPSRPSLALLDRGRQRFDIYCAPCHGIAGDGDGMIARRGFPHPPSFHSDALRGAPDSHYFAVITHGYGAMFPYADRVPPADRIAIIAYIRALQLAMHADAATLPQDVRARLPSR